MEKDPVAPLRIIILEDEPDDAELVERMLRKAGLHFTALRAENRAQFLAALDGPGADLLLADFTLPDITGLDAIRILRERGLDLPTILVTGSQGEEIAVECIREGAFDYILKDRMERLPTAVNRLLEHRKATREKAEALHATEQSEARFRNLFEKNLAGVYRSTPDGRLLEANEALARIFGYGSPQEILAQSAETLYPSPKDREVFLTTLMEKKSLFNVEIVGMRKGGERIQLLENVAWIEDSDLGAPVIEGTIFDITARKRAEAEIQASHRTQSILNQILALSLEDTSLSEFLQKVLDLVFGIPWLELMPKGALFFLDRTAGVLTMEAHKGLSEFLLSECRTVPLGRCLCGRAAEANKMVYSSHLNEHHEVRYEGILPHGHYCVPISSGNEVLGLLCLYLSDGHESHDHEVQVLEAIGHALAGIIRRKRAEALLATERARFEMFSRDAPFGIMVWDREGTVTFVNQGFTETFGYRAEDVPDRDSWRRLAYPDPEYRRTVECAWDLDCAEVTTGGPRQKVFDIRCKNGVERRVQITSSLLEDGSALLAFEDVTERLRTEEELRTSERIFREFFEHNPAASYMAGSSGELLSCNQAFCELFGFRDQDEALSVPMERLYEDPLDPCRLKEILSERRSISLKERRFRSPSGKALLALETAAGIFDERGRLTGVMGFLLDLTTNRELQAQFLHAQKMEAVGRLAGGVAHDFNNILTTILTFAEISSEILPAASPVKPHLDQIRVAAERAAKLTRQLLAYSRQQVIETKDVDLGVLADSVLKMVGRVLGESIQVEVVKEAGLPLVRGDAGQLEQVLMNLVINARDAMENGGKLTVELGRDTGEDGGEAPPWVFLRVTDTGIGMSPEVISKIFDPYFTTKAMDKGTGLGLSVVEGIVRHHGGTLRVDSEVGKGTSFIVLLPPVKKGRVHPAVADESLRSLNGRETLLLVEDEVGVRDATREALTSLGYRVIPAVDAAQALELFEAAKGEVDLVLSDMMMPGDVTGRTLCEGLKRRKPGLKTLLMSGHTEDLLLQQGVSSGEVHFIAKPFSRLTLASKLREVLDE